MLTKAWSRPLFMALVAVCASTFTTWNLSNPTTCEFGHCFCKKEMVVVSFGGMLVRVGSIATTRFQVSKPLPLAISGLLAGSHTGMGVCRSAATGHQTVLSET